MDPVAIANTPFIQIALPIMVTLIAAILLNNKRVDDIRDSMNRGFENVNRRFDDVNRRFDDVNRRFDSVDARFDSMERRLEMIQDNTHSLDIRVTKLEARS